MLEESKWRGKGRRRHRQLPDASNTLYTLSLRTLLSLHMHLGSIATLSALWLREMACPESIVIPPPPQLSTASPHPFTYLSIHPLPPKNPPKWLQCIQPGVFISQIMYMPRWLVRLSTWAELCIVCPSLHIHPSLPLHDHLVPAPPY